MERKIRFVMPLSTALPAMLFAAQASAASHTITGYVAKVTSMSSSQTYDDSFIVEDSSGGTGTCGTNADGKVVYVIKKETSTDPSGDRMFAIATDSIDNDFEIEIVVNDGTVDSRGFCYVSYISLLTPTRL